MMVILGNRLLQTALCGESGNLAANLLRSVTPCGYIKNASNDPMTETSSQLLNFVTIAVLVGFALMCFLHYRLDLRQEKDTKDSESDT